MNTFVYFIGEARAGNNNPAVMARLQQLGLGYLHDGAVDFRDVHSGPESLSGYVVRRAQGDTAALVKYDPTWRWRKMPWIENEHGVAVYMGWDPNALPTMADLQRGHYLPGHTLALANGETVIVPLARSVERGNVLPQTIGLDETGNWVAEATEDKYARLWAYAEALFDQLAGAADEAAGAKADDAKVTVTLDFDGEMDGAIEALAMNYRIGKLEAAQLGLFNQHTAGEILLRVIDWPTIEKLTADQSAEKKTAAASGGSNTNDGGGD